MCIRDRYWALLQIEIDGAYILELDKYAGGNIVTYIDYLILGDNHMWQQIHLDSGRLLGWEPEGLLSTIPAIATCLIGILAGQWIKRESAILDKISNLFAIGGILTVLALFWNLAFPFNKGLWHTKHNYSSIILC